MQKDEAAEVVVVGINQARGLVKEKPKQNTPTGSFRLMPSSNNNVHFKHNGEDCQLHFLTNGQIALSKDSNKDKFIELAANEFFANALNKF